MGASVVVYKDTLISTIVDSIKRFIMPDVVYKDTLISTIVDMFSCRYSTRSIKTL